jgi:hypothetical protein
MQFDESDLTSDIKKPKRKAEILNLLNHLHPAIQQIIAAEVKKDNLVCDAGMDYPDKGSIHATLIKRFNNQYNSPQARFGLTNDPHYWHADYMTVNETSDEPRHLLIC